jgi:surface protein
MNNQVIVSIGKKLTEEDITDNSTQAFNPANSHIYQYVNSNVNIGQASEIAENYLLSSKYDGHILTVDDENERVFFSGSGQFSNLIEDYVGVSWLGIHLENDQWVYLSPNSDLTSTVDYFNWASGQPRSDHGGYLWATQSGGWYSGYNLEYTQHLILEFDGFDTDVISDFYVGDIISSKLIDSQDATNISYAWQKSDDNLNWQNIESATTNELQISSDLIDKNIRLNINYEIEGETFTSNSSASPTVTMPGEIPHNFVENATIIQLNDFEIEGINGGFYHLHIPNWSVENNNLSISEAINFNDFILLQPVESDLSSTSDLLDFMPSSGNLIILSDSQKLALMELNGFNGANETIVPSSHMNLDTVNYIYAPSNDLRGYFSYDTGPNQESIPDITNWNTSFVTDMSRLFFSAYSFNQDISNWDTSSVIDMHQMFKGSYLFNQDIGNWDTSLCCRYA